MSLSLYGTHTSPYVRRVRILAHELGLDCQLIDTASDEGQARLRARSPIWKVPAAEIDGEIVFDSAVISELLLTRHGSGQLAVVPIDALESRNRLTVIDGALDALINCFYLGKDGVSPAQASYLAKQQSRAASAMTWVESRLGSEEAEQTSESLDLVDVALGTTAAWMRFRGTYSIDAHPKVVAFLERCETRESFISTRPPE